MWLLGFMGIGGIIGSVFKILATAVEAISPLVKGFFEFVVWYLKQLWEGFKDVIDNAATILFVVTVFGLGLFTQYKVIDKPRLEQCQHQVQVLKKQKPSNTPAPKGFSIEDLFRW